VIVHRGSRVSGSRVGLTIAIRRQRGAEVRPEPTTDMVIVSYTCPYCDAVVELDRPPVLADRSVTPEPREGYTYASTTDEKRDAADGIEFVCIGTEGNDEGCGRTFYLNFVTDAGTDHDGSSLEDPPRFDFRP